MPAWLLRGLGMAVLHGAAATILAKIAVLRPTDSTVSSSIVIALLIGAAALWSAIDAWLRRTDLGRTWFIAALVAGVVSAPLTVIGKAVFVDQTGASALGEALTGGAAFTALMVLIPAGLGMFVGGRLDPPGAGKKTDESRPAPDDQRASGEPAG
ncbi:B-4DMT family transporter [Amycolatopsis sp. cg5]|uniref:B-4DMT family transporter n=1 Tax=Amycolatopsis sp. cg5 TaxID=3238802 RepID=UPI00352688A1